MVRAWMRLVLRGRLEWRRLRAGLADRESGAGGRVGCASTGDRR